MLGHLAGAIRSFKNVKKVIWEIGEHEPSWMHDLIMKTLPDLPLESLVISIYERTFPSLQLSQLSHLRRICIEWPGIYYNSADALFSELAKLISQSPKLSHLELCLPRSSLQTLIQNLIAISPLSLEHLSVAWMRVLPEDILHLSRHLRNLKYLGLNKYINSSSLNNQPHDEIWERLQAQEIYLNNISTDCIDDFLVSYLDSFEGLGHLRLTTKNVATQPVRLLAAISAHHANSLVEFDLFAEHGRDEWAWPFDDQLKALLPSLYNLKYLGVTTHSLPDAASSGDENHIHALISFCEKSFPRLEILTLYFSPFRFWNSGAEVHFFKHRKVVHPSAYAYGSLSKQLHQAITTYQVVNTPPSTFRIMTKAQMFVRLHDSRTGAFPFTLTE
ncbi:hypothetical protein GALMADRAFT_423982 [Galerina marginata CBS 339.88]|uniref:F-box domain-containing protein n=1 Tax=Galerina marginata (strain CBS 339.88) TaxID=685588 RepID=A0A067T1F3_GALM3|nr:hypothetical protein GALMADRAFT_423982 [Galerina marginata CBS 339.88]